MYSTVEKESWISRPQIDSKTLTIAKERESVFLEELYPELDSQFTEARDYFCDRSSEQPENYIDFSQKENKAESVFIQKNLTQLKQEINQLEISLSQQNHERQEFLDRRFNQGMKNLQAQAEHINDLAAQLEKEMLKFKAIARKVNRDYHAIQDSHNESNPNLSDLSSDSPYRTRPANIWEIRSSVIPTVVKQGNQFILITKQVLEVSEDNDENRAKKAQQRQKALASWLEGKRQRIIEDVPHS